MHTPPPSPQVALDLSGDLLHIQTDMVGLEVGWHALEVTASARAPPGGHAEASTAVEGFSFRLMYLTFDAQEGFMDFGRYLARRSPAIDPHICPCMVSFKHDFMFCHALTSHVYDRLLFFMPRPDACARVFMHMSTRVHAEKHMCVLIFLCSYADK
jgi:hypothetical protein